jgi:superfamily II DNA helicase RecQ
VRIVAMLLGETIDLPPALAKLSTFGRLRGETSDALGAWIDASIAAGLVVVSDDRYRTLGLTEHGREMMLGRLDNAQLRRPSRRPRLAMLHRQRAERLREFRNRWNDDWLDPSASR